MKENLPMEISKEMKQWRAGLISIPQSYIDWHMRKAVKAIAELEDAGWKIWGHEMQGDGWMDGMKVMYAVIERGGELKKIHWHDGNQGWMEEMTSGGSGIFITK